MSKWFFRIPMMRKCYGAKQISGIVAAALTPNAAPYTGQLVTQRLVLSCSLFHKETPATWNEKRLSLERAYEMIKQPILRGRLSDRHSQIATSLFNRERLLESGDLEPTHQYSLMLSASPWAKTVWNLLHYLVKWMKGGQQCQL